MRISEVEVRLKAYPFMFVWSFNSPRLFENILSHFQRQKLTDKNEISDDSTTAQGGRLFKTRTRNSFISKASNCRMNWKHAIMIDQHYMHTRSKFSHFFHHSVMSRVPSEEIKIIVEHFISSLCVVLWSNSQFLSLSSASAASVFLSVPGNLFHIMCITSHSFDNTKKNLKSHSSRRTYCESRSR